MNLRACLWISLGLNVLLGGWLLATSYHGSRSTPDLSAAVMNSTTSAAPERVIREPAPVIVEVIEPWHWSRIEAADYVEYMRNLRSIKCPEKTIRTLIISDVSASYRTRVKELTREAVDGFWSIVLDREALVALVESKQKELRSLEAERGKLLESLLNDPDPGNRVRSERSMSDGIATFHQKLEFLSDDKFEGVHEVMNRMSNARSELYQEFQSRNERDSPEHKARLEALELQERAELESFLTAEEMEELNLRNSKSSEVRLGLWNFDATEAEIRAIAAAESDPKAQDALRSMLGSERYADLQRAKDDAYQGALKVTERYGLPASVAADAYKVHNESNERAKAIREDSSRTAEERMILLTAIRDEAERSLSTLLGQKVMKTYSGFAGHWLTQMTNSVSE